MIRYRSACRLLITCLIFSFIVQGCSFGPTWQGEVTLPPLSKKITAKRVIVSSFMDADYMALKLRQQGIDAVHIDSAGPSTLKAGEVLVRGMVMMDYYRPKPHSFFSDFFFFVTIGIIGGILPSPFTFYSGAKVTYHVEIIDAKGTLLMQSDDQTVIGEYQDLWYWPITEFPGKYMKRISYLVLDKLAVVLAERLR